MTVHFCTAVTRNYLGYASALAEGLARHHPSSRLQMLVVDGEEGALPAPLPGGAELLDRHSLSIGEKEFLRLATMYGAFEISNALKPTVMRTVLDRGAPHVIWIDVDMLVMGSLADVADAAERGGVVLTPHHVRPAPRIVHRTDPERVALTAGTYNAGLVAAAGDSGKEMLSWWTGRVARDCVTVPEEGLFVDQRFLDLVPGMFGAHILRDPGVNFGWWRAASSVVASGPDGPRVDGVPLRLLHLSGFDRRSPWRLTSHEGAAPAALASAQLQLGRLVSDYRTSLEAHRVDHYGRLGYRFASLRRGTPLDARMRRLYRDALIAYERGDRATEPPSPFIDGDEAFLDWLRAPPVIDPGVPGIGRYLRDVWQEHPELPERFPEVPGRDSVAYAQWTMAEGRRNERIPFEVLPRGHATEARRPSCADVLVLDVVSRRPTDGWLARSVRDALSRLPHDVEHWTINQLDDVPRLRGAAPSIILLVGTPGEVRYLNHLLGHELRVGSEVIALLDWSTEEPGAAAEQSIARLAARLVPARWTGVRVGGKVSELPVPIRIENGAAPDGRLSGFACLVDCETPVSSEAGVAALEAYVAAFSGDGPGFALIAANGERNSVVIEQARYLARGRGDIRIVEASPGEALGEALACGESFVSLVEGPGIDLAAFAALACGRPTILAGTEANLDFLGAAGAFPVPAGATGSDAPRRHASDHMITIQEDLERTRSVAHRSAAEISRGRSIEALSASLSEIIDAVNDHRARRSSR